MPNNDENITQEKPSVSELLKNTEIAVPEEHYVIINRAFRIFEIMGNITGYEDTVPEDTMPVMLHLKHELLQASLEEVVTTCVREKRRVAGQINELVLSDTTKYIRFEATPFRHNDHDEELYLIIFNSFIPEAVLNRIQQEAEQRIEAFATSNAELERFAYVASHDLQEPLRMVTNFLHLLQRKYKESFDETATKYIYFAVDGAERMKQLINDLLQYSRIGINTLEIESVDMNAIVNDAIQIFEHNSKNTGATIISDSLPTISAGKIPMAQLIQNLLSNALKYRSAIPPVVNISYKENQHEWIFSISDNGIGIHQQFWSKIFVVFQRLHNKDEYSGTGIGLTICKKIVERYNGRIWVVSLPGAGSTFTFTIPKKITHLSTHK